jgi:hypothetical protein
MGEILGVGCTHRPLMLRPNEDWTFMMRAALDDPAMPDEMKNPASWPAPLREELGNDWGASAAVRGREVYRAHFAEARRVIDEFNPDVVIMWGDDQYENFKEDIVPPFAVLAYDDQELQPWAHRRSPWNPWNEPSDTKMRVRGHREAGKHLASGLIEAGIDVGYAYKPLHHPMGHAFENTVILLDDERRGFDYPLVQFSVNCYGRRVNAARGLRLPLAMRDEVRKPDSDLLDPPGPNPHRCMQVGAAAARVMAQSPWRTAFVASSSWSHSFLTEKNWQLWPDVAADRRLYDALETGDYAAWHRYTTDQIEESGQHEVLNWFCLLGAMEELGRKPDKAAFIESWAFVSPVVFAYYTA